MSLSTATARRPFSFPVYKADFPRRTESALELSDKEALHAQLVQQLDRPSTKALTEAPTDVAAKGRRVNSENTFGRRTDLYAHDGKFYVRRMSLTLDEVTREPTGSVKIQWYSLAPSQLTTKQFTPVKKTVLTLDRFVVR